MKSNNGSTSKNNLFLASIPSSTSFCTEQSLLPSSRKSSYKSSPHMIMMKPSFSPSSSMDMSACINQTFLHQAIHFCFIGGKENVSGCAFFDLAGECAGRTEIENDFVAGTFFVRGGDLFQRIRQARSGEDVDLGGVKFDAEKQQQKAKGVVRH